MPLIFSGDTLERAKGRLDPYFSISPVLLQCSMAGTGQVLAVFPPAKTLPQVRRVLNQWNEEP